MAAATRDMAAATRAAFAAGHQHTGNYAVCAPLASVAAARCNMPMAGLHHNLSARPWAVPATMLQRTSLHMANMPLSQVRSQRVRPTWWLDSRSCACSCALTMIHITISVCTVMSGKVYADFIVDHSVAALPLQH
jgi:hypothetical protein